MSPFKFLLCQFIVGMVYFLPAITFFIFIFLIWYNFSDELNHFGKAIDTKFIGLFKVCSL